MSSFSGQEESPVSMLNQFNKKYNEADSVNCPVQIAITNQKLSKVSFLPKYIPRSITMQFMPVSLDLPGIFYITASSNMSCAQ